MAYVARKVCKFQGVKYYPGDKIAAFDISKAEALVKMGIIASAVLVEDVPVQAEDTKSKTTRKTKKVKSEDA